MTLVFFAPWVIYEASLAIFLTFARVKGPLFLLFFCSNVSRSSVVFSHSILLLERGLFSQEQSGSVLMSLRFFFAFGRCGAVNFRELRYAFPLCRTAQRTIPTRFE